MAKPTGANDTQLFKEIGFACCWGLCKEYSMG